MFVTLGPNFKRAPRWPRGFLNVPRNSLKRADFGTFCLGRETPHLDVSTSPDHLCFDVWLDEQKINTPPTYTLFLWTTQCVTRYCMWYAVAHLEHINFTTVLLIQPVHALTGDKTVCTFVKYCTHQIRLQIVHLSKNHLPQAWVP